MFTFFDAQRVGQFANFGPRRCDFFRRYAIVAQIRECNFTQVCTWFGSRFVGGGFELSEFLLGEAGVAGSTFVSRVVFWFRPFCHGSFDLLVKIFAQFVHERRGEKKARDRGDGALRWLSAKRALLDLEGVSIASLAKRNLAYCLPTMASDVSNFERKR